MTERSRAACRASWSVSEPDAGASLACPVLRWGFVTFVDSTGATEVLSAFASGPRPSPGFLLGPISLSVLPTSLSSVDPWMRTGAFAAQAMGAAQVKGWGIIGVFRLSEQATCLCCSQSRHVHAAYSDGIWFTNYELHLQGPQ